MNSGILKQHVREQTQEELYAELRTQFLRKNDWQRVKRLLLVCALTAAGVSLVWQGLIQLG